MALTLGLVVGALVSSGLSMAGWLGWSGPVLLQSFALSNAVIGASFGVCGAVLAWQRPTNPIGWWFATGGLLQAVSCLLVVLADLVGRDAQPVWLPRLIVTGFIFAWPWAIGLCYPMGLLLFPSGRMPNRAWRWAVVAVIATAPLFVAEMATEPASAIPGFPPSYLALPTYDSLSWLWTAAELRTGFVYLLALLALVVRYRRGGDTTRRQLLWLILALTIALAGMIPWGLVAGTTVLVLFAIPLIPAAITVAVVRHQLLDIRIVVSRVLAWAVLSLLVILGYAGLVVFFDTVLKGWVGRSAVVTLILVLVAAPLLPWLQRWVDRVLYGARADPALVASQVSAHLQASVQLRSVLGSIRRTLRLPYASLSSLAGLLAEDGDATGAQAAVSLVHDGEEVGALAVGLRSGEKRLAPADRSALELLAGPLAATLRAMVVSDQLAASRERLVEVREEERRRLRRDLHDGLGPALTGLALTADAAALTVTDTDRTRELLDCLRRDARGTLLDVRRIVDDLSPSALDELGLSEALRARATQLQRRADGSTLTVVLDLPAELPSLSPAIELAAYRIAVEALTNVVRHSDATTAWVRVRAGTEVEVRVTDNGTDRAAWVAGVGLASMTERATEVHGVVTAAPGLQGGTVEAVIPLGST